MFIFAGDIAFNGLFTEDPDNNTRRFRQIIPVLKKAKMVFANLGNTGS